jgi:hypothetical protein
MVVCFSHTQKQEQKLKQPKRLYYDVLKQIKFLGSRPSFLGIQTKPNKIIDLLTMKSNL